MSRTCEEAGVRHLRMDLLAAAAGRVLEIGAGTGLNLPHYGGKVESLVVAEPERPMLGRLQQAVREQAPTTMVVQAPAEDLPFDDDSFDIVVSTLVLCGVDDQPRAGARSASRPAPGRPVAVP
jgi:ubiquinone/menaquinone biosynthesis C-methylase UbiE